MRCCAAVVCAGAVSCSFLARPRWHQRTVVRSTTIAHCLLTLLTSTMVDAQTVISTRYHVGLLASAAPRPVPNMAYSVVRAARSWCFTAKLRLLSYVWLRGILEEMHLVCIGPARIAADYAHRQCYVQLCFPFVLGSQRVLLSRQTSSDSICQL